MLEPLKENGELSLTRIITALGFVTFIIASLYLIYTGKTWGNYETFAIMSAGGSAATQVSNKYINSRFNTLPGESGKPNKTGHEL